MMFFPEIDETATLQNSARKLREHQRWKRVAGETDQKVTATYSFDPRQPHSAPGRPTETLVINKVDAERELEAIEEAISKILKPELRRLLIERFLPEVPKSVTEVCEGIGYEKTQYQHLKDEALLAFAEIFKNGVLVVTKTDF